jgi:hypothetical protein
MEIKGMKGIKKYHTFLEARLDLYKDMWERGFDLARISHFLKKLKKSLVARGIIQSPLYPPGIYPFKTFKEAEEDLNKREELNNDNS